jgi:hypothetical protein
MPTTTAPTSAPQQSHNSAEPAPRTHKRPRAGNLCVCGSTLRLEGRGVDIVADAPADRQSFERR